MYKEEVKSKRLEVYFLNVGQGDASLIRTPSNHLVLIDGGQPNSSVLTEIGKVLPFYRRRINLIVATHPDADHIGGLSKVIGRYNSQIILQSGVRVDTWVDQLLQKSILENKLQSLRARKGMNIIFTSSDGNNVDRNIFSKINIESSLNILFPDRNVDSWIKKTNDASIVARLNYSSTSFMFTGDSPVNVEYYLQSIGALAHVDVLKIGHHGSRTSTSEGFIKTLSPSIAVISAGNKNRYGHPHQEVLNVLNRNNVKVLRTDQRGTIKIKSDSASLKII